MDINGEKYNRSDWEDKLSRHRVNILSKFVDRNFIYNPAYRKKVESFMVGNIKAEIMEALDVEYSVLKDDPNDEYILSMVNEKVENFIQKLYP